MSTKRYVVTSAQAYASPHSQLWRGLQRYAKKMGAEIIVLPMIGKNAKEDLDGIHSELKPYAFYGRELRLNSNIKIKKFSIKPQQIDPTTGLSRFAQRGTTIIFASPKQRLTPIPHSNRKYPKFLVTTGAVTMPRYADDDSSIDRRRLGDIAREDHVYGALVVEVVDDEIYHFRHLRANSEGSFVDLGVRYTDRKTKPSRLEAFVAGDWHNGQTDPTIKEVTYQMIKALKPRRLVLHDFFDGHSVNHHTEKKLVREKLIHMVDNHFHLLDKELRDGYEQLMTFNELMEGRQIIVVFSNHHAFLHRYLDEGRFYRDLSNFRTATDLLRYMAEKDYNDPVYAGFRKFGRIPRNIRFLREDEDYKVWGYQLGSHGHNVPFGQGYGSMNTKENDWGKSITGHVHRGQILRNTYTVGTCLPRNMFYMRGFPSAWTHTHALLWDNGCVQLVNVIGDKWRG